MSKAPIGVFDSGLGGLTAVKELQHLLPGENIVYLGDTGRVPYGSKGKDIIITYAKEDIAFLLSKGVKCIIAACGTVSTTLPPEVAASLPVPYTGVIEAACDVAVQATKNNKIGVIGTAATIRSGSYARRLQALLPGVECTSAACPLYVPLVENGHFAPDDALARIVTEEYLAPVRAAGVDTLIMGCTHYPLLRDTIAAYMGTGVTLVDPGRETARVLKEKLGANGNSTGGTTTYHVTDDPEHFGKLAAIFLDGEVDGTIDLVVLEGRKLQERRVEP